MKPNIKIAIVVFIVTLGMLFKDKIVALWQSQETTLEFVQDSKNRIYLPVRIKDSTYYFIFDTGSNCRFAISQILLDTLGCKVGNKIESHLPHYNIIDQLDQTEEIGLNIGNLSLREQCPVIPNVMKEDGVVGMGFIQDYFWNFDLNNKTVTFGEKENLLHNIEKYDVALDLHYKDTIAIMTVEMLIHDSVPELVLFDTGHSDGVWTSKSGHKLYPEFFVYTSDSESIDSIYKHFKSNYSTTIEPPLNIQAPNGKEVFPLFVKDFSFNGYDPYFTFYSIFRKRQYERFRQTDHNEFKGTISLGPHFLRRFNRFMIDPINKQILFRGLKSDSSLYGKNQMQLFLNEVVIR